MDVETHANPCGTPRFSSRVYEPMKRQRLNSLLAVILLMAIYVVSYFFAVAPQVVVLRPAVGRTPVAFHRIAFYRVPPFAPSWSGVFVTRLYEPLQLIDAICIRPDYWHYDDWKGAWAAREEWRKWMPDSPNSGSSSFLSPGTF